jgi:MtN3 and saliva related transmembrane protein
MYLAFATGVAFWFLFGFLIDNWPIMISNAITFALTAAIVAMKIRYG